MGCLGGGDSQAQAANKAANKQMKQAKARLDREIKVLLLGAGESGKSTIFKQMKIIHQSGYSREECMMFKDIVHGNTLKAMRALVQASLKLGVPIESPENRERAQRINDIDNESLLNVQKVWSADLGRDIGELWKDAGIQATFERRSEFQLEDAAKYYFDNLTRINSADYVPTTEDVLRSRVKTTGIVETEFQMNSRVVKMIDVGGQRNERKKWMHCFEGVTAVIFVAAMSEYDQKLYEDDQTNRMHESLQLFDEVCNNKFFKDTSIILFLNKVDIFREKIKKTDLKVCFPEYDGGCNFERASEFLIGKFHSLNKNKDTKTIFTHMTCATDTNHLAKIFEAIRDILLQEVLQREGLLPM